MMPVQQTEIRELTLEEIDQVSGGGIGDTIVNVAKEIANAVYPTGSVTLPSIPEIGGAIKGVGSVLGSLF